MGRKASGVGGGGRRSARVSADPSVRCPVVAFLAPVRVQPELPFTRRPCECGELMACSTCGVAHVRIDRCWGCGLAGWYDGYGGRARPAVRE